MRVVNFCGIVRRVIDEENLRKFRCEGVRRFYGDRSEAVSWSTHDGRGENLQFSHWGPQRKPTKCLWWGERRQKSLKWTWSARKVQSVRSSCRTRVQRYDEHLGFCKSFAKKMQTISLLLSGHGKREQFCKESVYTVYRVTQNCERYGFWAVLPLMLKLFVCVAFRVPECREGLSELIASVFLWVTKRRSTVMLLPNWNCACCRILWWSYSDVIVPYPCTISPALEISPKCCDDQDLELYRDRPRELFP